MSQLLAEQRGSHLMTHIYKYSEIYEWNDDSYYYYKQVRSNLWISGRI